MTEDEDQEYRTEEAAAVLLEALWKHAAKRGLCPICILHCAMDMVVQAEEENSIGHGIPVADEGTVQ